MSLLEQIKKDIESNPLVGFVGQKEEDIDISEIIKGIKSGNLWKHKIRLTVAPYLPTYNVKGLQHILDNLVKVEPKMKINFHTYSYLNELYFGSLIFEEKIGEIKTTNKETKGLNLQGSYLELGSTSTESVANLYRGIFVRLYPDKKIAMEVINDTHSQFERSMPIYTFEKCRKQYRKQK